MNKIADYLEKLADDNPDGVEVHLFFKGSPMPTPGAFRRSRNHDGLYELLSPGMANNKPVLALILFQLDNVERVLTFVDAPQSSIITPGRGGLQI